MGYLKLLDEFEKENGKSTKAGVAAHDARFEFALWLERKAAQPAAETEPLFTYKWHCSECGDWHKDTEFTCPRR